jgi:hypothetical protein
LLLLAFQSCICNTKSINQSIEVIQSTKNGGKENERMSCSEKSSTGSYKIGK